MDGLSVFRSGDRSGKSARLQMLLKLMDKSSEGFSSEEICSILRFLGTNKVNTLKPLLNVCLPRSEISNEVLFLALDLLRVTFTSTVHLAVLNWLLAGVNYFFSRSNIALLQHRYDAIFSCIGRQSCAKSACALLAMITLRNHVRHYRVHSLVHMSATNVLPVHYYQYLLSVYRRLRPDLVPPANFSSSSSGSVSMSDRTIIGTDLLENLEKWLNHSSRSSAQCHQSLADSHHNLWTHNQVGRSRFMRKLAALPQQQQLQLTGAGARLSTASAAAALGTCSQTAAVHIASIQTVDEAVQLVATSGRTGQKAVFAPINCVTPLLVDRQRSVLLFLSGQMKSVQFKGLFELTTHLQQLAINLRAQSGSVACTSSSFIHQLVASQQGALRIPVDLGVLIRLLDNVRYEYAPEWLPLLPLLSSIPWIPHSELSLMLKSVADIAVRCDRFTRRVIVSTLSALVVNLVERELPLLKARKFPYDCPERCGQLDRCADMEMDLVRSVELCRRVCETASIHNINSDALLLQYLIFCHTVTSCLLDNGIAVVMLVDRSVISRVVFSLDPVALNYMTDMFSRYPQWLHTLERYRDTSSERVNRLAALVIAKMAEMSPLLTAVKSLLFGGNTRQCVSQLLLSPSLEVDSDDCPTDTAGGAHLDEQTVRVRLMLLNHPAVRSFLPGYLALCRSETEASTVGFAKYLSSVGLAGFINFYNAR